MRILMISQRFYPGTGGVQRQALQLAQRLRSQGVEVAVVTAGRPGLTAFERLGTLPVYRTARPREGYVGLAVSMASLFAFLLRRGRWFDLFHIRQALFAAFVGVLAGKLLGRPAVVTVTGSGASGSVATLRSRRSGPALRRVIAHADAVVSLSAESTEELATIGIRRTVVSIPNGVDTAHFRPATDRRALRRRLGLPPGPIVFHAGRLSPEKGQDVLVEAWPQVTGSHGDALLLLAGDGPERAALHAAVRRLGVADRVCFLGDVPDVAPYLAASDVFVLPSRAEGMSNALLEALATGLPCLASAVGGNQAVIAPGENGLLSPPEDARELAAGLRALLSDGALRARLAVAARQTAERRFSLDSVADRHRALYTSLLEV